MTVDWILLLLGFSIVGSSSAIRTGIVNGIDVRNGEFPFMVSIRSTLGTHFCGGTVISNLWILTAAHCAKMSNDLTVEYSTTTISIFGTNIVTITDIIIHPRHNPDDNMNDIALLRMMYPLEGVQPVRLPEPYFEAPPGTPVTVVGWGYEQTNGEAQMDLKKVTIMTYTNGVCRQIHRLPISLSQICAGVPEGGKGQCTGDSGGPLMSGSIQLGIVSWSTKPCAAPPYPGIFTKISYFRDWIYSVARV